jgi:hypothetical protein
MGHFKGYFMWASTFLTPSKYPEKWPYMYFAKKYPPCHTLEIIYRRDHMPNFFRFIDVYRFLIASTKQLCRKCPKNIEKNSLRLLSLWSQVLHDFARQCPFINPALLFSHRC